ncbi:uncharacterized protein [Temnothorax nylanderi]|uniref:uncharacterized protein n=1 Tax=Temnothorax nylanderi TaxID=102681 RepID=UPI003A83DC02
MVRNNTKKNKRKLRAWKASELQSALRSITHGPKLKIRQAGRQFGIPESTLRMHLKNFGELRETLGRKPTFTAQEEAELVGHILRLAGMNNGIAFQDLCRVVFEFAEAKRIKHYFNKKSKMAGRRWLYRFLKRNPQISLRQLEGTSLNRIAVFNKDKVNFFSNLEAVMKKHKFTPHRIYNMDETEITTVREKCSSSVYTAEGKKRIGAVTSDERGRTVIAAFCMNAAGCYIPPMMIFPGVCMDSRLQHNGPIGAIYGCSKNGLTNEVLFCQWLEHFVKHVKPTADDPVLLILDYHSSQVSTAAYTFCIDNSITVVTVPPHTSQAQPLGLTFFGPLKNAMHQEFKLYLTSHLYEKIGEHNLAEFLNKAFIKVASVEKGISGFRSAGIWPLDRPDIFEENDFAPPDENNENVVQNSIIAAEWCVYEESANENVNLSDKSITSDDR